MFRKNRLKIAFGIVFLFSGLQLFAQSEPPFIKYMYHPWADSIMKTLTIEEQIAQCIWVAGWSDKTVAHETEMSLRILLNIKIPFLSLYYKINLKQSRFLVCSL